MQSRIIELKAQIESLAERLDEKQSECINLNMNWFEYKSVTKPLETEYTDLHRELRMLIEPSMELIPEYGDHMTIVSFIDNCKAGGFIDYDGSGNYATDKEMSDISVYPSDIKAGKYRKDFTHIVWFNK
jgi:hypothetical protein